MRKILIPLSLILLSLSANANPNDISLGVPSYGGTGCSAGSASVALSPDRKALSMLFDSYVVEAIGRNRTERKSCNIAVPVHVPQGYSVAVFKVDYRGFNSLPQGAMSMFGVEYFFAGYRGPQMQKNFYGNLMGNYTLSNTLAASAVVWSPCGQQTLLRANTNMMVRSNDRGDQAMATVDSVDIRSGLVYHLQWRRC